MPPTIGFEPARSRITCRRPRTLMTRNVRHTARPGPVVNLLAKGEGR